MVKIRNIKDYNLYIKKMISKTHFSEEKQKVLVNLAMTSFLDGINYNRGNLVIEIKD